MVEHHEPSKHAAHEDVYVTLRDAFNAAGRKLQDYVRRRRGKVKRTKHRRAPMSANCFLKRIMASSKRRTEERFIFTRTPFSRRALNAWRSASKFCLPKRWEKKAQATSVRVN